MRTDPIISKLDVVYSSLLRCATKALWLILEELSWEWVPTVKDWRLNERSYGALVGEVRNSVEHYGKDQLRFDF